MSQASSDTFEIPELETVERLISKYDKPGPRYTSYPTAPVWTEEFGEEDLRAALARSPGGDVSIYIHIPFCESLCSYCACNREIHRDHGVVGPYLEGLECEAGRMAEAVGKPLKAVQLAMGGGTPTYLSARELDVQHSSLELDLEEVVGGQVGVDRLLVDGELSEDMLDGQLFVGGKG